MLSRRSCLQALAGSAPLLAARPGFGQTLQTITVAVGQKAVAPNLINLLIGEILGYNKIENLHANFMMVGGVSNAQIAINRNQVDIATGVPSFALPILARGKWGGATHFYQYT